MSSNVVRTQRKAFTIVEIVVVVVVIALLATLIVPRLFGRVGKTRQAVAQQKLAEIEKAIELFSYEYGRLPETLNELVIRPGDIPEDKWESPTLKEKDLLDPWGRTFVYVTPGAHGLFDLYTFGADNAEGGDHENADVVNW